jgi:tetratricopeptide (TPR) repeat protein
MSTNQDVQSMEETLNKTDLGSLINENKKTVGVIAALLVVGLITFVGYSRVRESNQKEMLNKAFALEQSVFEAYQTNKLKSEDFLAKFQAIDSSFYGQENLYPPLIAALTKLKADKKLNEEVMGKVQLWLNALDKRSRLYLITGLSVASLWEDLQKYDRSIGIYEELKKRPSDLLKDQIFFNLGRMYMKTQDKAAAQKHFEFIFKEYSDTEFAQLARLYLSEL